MVANSGFAVALGLDEDGICLQQVYPVAIEARVDIRPLLDQERDGATAGET